MIRRKNIMRIDAQMGTRRIRATVNVPFNVQNRRKPINLISFAPLRNQDFASHRA